MTKKPGSRVTHGRSGVKYKHTPPPVLPFLSHRTMLKPSIRISESRMLLFRKVSVRPTNSYVNTCSAEYLRLFFAPQLNILEPFL